MRAEWKNLQEKRDALKKGSQVVYVPMHAHGDVYHPDAKYGFVMSVQKGAGTVFVRYFATLSPLILYTRANSERTDITDLFPLDFTDQGVIDDLVKEIENGSLHSNH